MNNKKSKVNIFHGDAIEYYSKWPSPSVIISDGPYGIGSFEGDPNTPNELPQWYEPHIKSWSKLSNPATTLWFWNTEIGWAKVHPILEKYGWTYKSCNIWNKGIAHIAGNSNTKNLSHLPIVTEVCVQYVKEPRLDSGENTNLSLKEWLRSEWERTGLPFTKTNDACGVKNAATRKYFTKCHLWYSPPPDVFEQLVEYANKHGDESGKPYFSTDGISSLNKDDWARLRPIFKCPIGITNVWDLPAVRGQERIKNGTKAIHLNQKPLKLMEMIIESSSKELDAIWEPFGGLCSAGIAAGKLNRRSYCAEINDKYFDLAVLRSKTDWGESLFTQSFK